MILRLLQRFMSLGVEGEDPKPQTADIDVDNLDLESADAAADAVEKPTSTESPPEPRRSDSDRRASELESQLESERAARRALEQRAPQPTTSTDAEYEREEAELRRLEAQGATQDQIGWARWKITQDRSSRETRRYADQALNEARNQSDRSEFGRLEITNPKLYKRYAEKVEQAYQQSARSGTPVSRNVILRVMIGDDIVAGNIKPKSAPAKPETVVARVDRGRPPGAVRSDVQSRQSRNDREARRERLSKINI